MEKYIKQFLIICLLFTSCSSSKNTANVEGDFAASRLYPYGRYIIDTNQNLELISSAVHFGFSFHGEECRIFVSLPNAGEHSYLQYELDGVYQKKLRIEGNISHPILLKAPKDGDHTVWIYKATEAQTGPVMIQKISGKNIRALRVKEVPFIEFIGNSITCGAASDASEVPCGTGVYHDQHNAYYSYGPRTARALGVNYVLSCVSGIGVYRNWNSDGPTMPQVYEKTDFQYNHALLWNFKLFTPQIVSIALGTNDFSHGDGIKKRLPFDSSLYVSNYINFVKLIKSKYPEAQIALLSSPMVNGNDRTILQNCLTAVKQNIDALFSSNKPVALFFFKPMHAHGCNGHPTIEEHAILANELIPFFKNLLQ